MTLIEYIKEENNKSKERMANEPGLWIGLWSEDIKHWNTYGIYTVDNFKRYLLVSAIWDCHKDIYGIRPRHLDLDHMSMDELQSILDSLMSEYKEN